MKPSVTTATITIRNNYARQGGAFFIQDVYNGYIEKVTI
jgi:predicted outer membrane repeat protein